MYPRLLTSLQQAEAESESKYLQGLGIARQRQAIMKGLQESVVSFSGQIPGTSARTVMDMMMLTQVRKCFRTVSHSPDYTFYQNSMIQLSLTLVFDVFVASVHNFYHTIETRTCVLSVYQPQYNDMIKDVGAQPRSNTIFIPDSADELGKLRAGVMQGNLSTARMLR